ncbi:hypothetical protein OWR29_26500 [Actinoplanes sp. Pm04-4]|uniref:Uncharacterized protein n=1 Tax=Paractinoplanes pyxinae TaxID=2997416 RepID=A0ABT4B4Y2_9ACTN|nr:hypothetical protein [Actinoplanes pyxinae]MCY1141564.1 hypothetical protein [Actinoplanes pyxinae]
MTFLRDMAAVSLAAVLVRPRRRQSHSDATDSTAPNLMTEQAMLSATKTTARATWAGAAVALVAVVLSAVAWSGQRKLNHDQQELNRGQKQLNQDQGEINKFLLLRAQRVYASRVAIWAMNGREKTSDFPAGLDVFIQNRAPVPLRTVKIQAPLDTRSPSNGSISIGDIPPCTLRTFRLSAPPPHKFRNEASGWLSYSGLTLEFSETDRQWILQPDHLELIIKSPAGDAQLLSLLVPRPPETKDLTDCSESG